MPTFLSLFYQSFARLSAVYGGTYMLNKPDCEVVYDEQGRACGVQSDGETAKCKFVVGDPSYFPGKVTHSFSFLSPPLHSLTLFL